MIIVDTNVLVYRWLPGVRTAETDLLTRLDPDWAAPVLWRSEFRNVVAGFVRRRELDLVVAQTAIAKAAASLLKGEHTVSDEAVLRLLNKSRCSSYDCEFVALAEAFSVLLVTEDKALLNAFPTYCRSLAQTLQLGTRR